MTPKWAGFSGTTLADVVAVCRRSLVHDDEPPHLNEVGEVALGGDVEGGGRVWSDRRLELGLER